MLANPVSSAWAGSTVNVAANAAATMSACLSVIVVPPKDIQLIEVGDTLADYLLR